MNVAGSIHGRPASPPPVFATGNIHERHANIHEQPGEAHNMPDEQWLTYDALAAHWQIGPEAARARVRRGRFQRRTNNLGAVEVLLDVSAPIPKARKSGQGRQTGTATPSDTLNTETASQATAAALSALQAHIDHLTAALQRAEAATAAERQRTADLTSELLRLTADLLAARQTAERSRSWWARLTGTGG
jgi:hypothetical protein